MRVWALDSAPPGLTHDEASNGHDSAAILRGIHKIYFPVGYGHEPLYDYSVAGLTLLMGQSIFTLRLTTVFWSMATWVLTLTLVRRWWGHRTALMTGIAMTLGFWPLMMARVGLRGPTLPALLAASALAYDYAINTKSRNRALGYGIAGLCLGATFYTYMASRGMPLLYLTFLVGMALFNRELLRKMWVGTLAVLIIAGLIALPLYLHLNANPQLETRVAQLGGALIAAKSGDFGALWTNIRDSLPMLFWKADPRWLYNVAGRPALEPLLAIAFLGGCIRAIMDIKDRRNLFTLLWLGGGLAPAFLTTVEFNTLHAIAALPPVFILTGQGLSSAWAWIDTALKKRAGALGQRIATATFCAALVLSGIESTGAYFRTWANEPQVRTLYHHHIVALARKLETLTHTQNIVISSVTPGEFHDPYTLEVALRREDLNIRWINGYGALYFPSGKTRLYTDAQTELNPQFLAITNPVFDATPTLTFSSEDRVTSIQGYNWDADKDWEALEQTLNTTVYVAAGDPPPQETHSPVSPPPLFADSGAGIELRGYTLTPPVASAGTTLNVLTAWIAQAPHPEELVIFTHLLNKENTIITQQDRLDAPSWQWQSGDRFVQLHQITLPPELPAGQYWLASGIYKRASDHKLTINTETGAASRVLIPVSVE